MKYYVLFYDVANDYVSRRPAFRAEHLRLAQEAYQRGDILLAGALIDQTDRALLVSRVPHRAVVIGNEE